MSPAVKEMAKIEEALYTYVTSGSNLQSNFMYSAPLVDRQEAIYQLMNPDRPALKNDAILESRYRAYNVRLNMRKICDDENDVILLLYILGRWTYWCGLEHEHVEYEENYYEDTVCYTSAFIQGSKMIRELNLFIKANDDTNFQLASSDLIMV